MSPVLFFWLWNSQALKLDMRSDFFCRKWQKRQNHKKSIVSHWKKIVWSSRETKLSKQLCLLEMLKATAVHIIQEIYPGYKCDLVLEWQQADYAVFFSSFVWNENRLGVLFPEMNWKGIFLGGKGASLFVFLSVIVPLLPRAQNHTETTVKQRIKGKNLPKAEGRWRRCYEGT